MEPEIKGNEVVATIESKVSSQDINNQETSLKSEGSQSQSNVTQEKKAEATLTEKQLDSKSKRWKKRMRFQPKNVVLEKEETYKYYEKLLDGSDASKVQLPRVLPAMNYASACGDEIQAMLSAIKQHSGNKTALQILPRHMRRRAASHITKRLPRRLRELANQQAALEGGDSSKKVACRRKRRRNVDLRNEYTKRARNKGWLETHMWHAKRFKMTNANDAHYSEWRHRVAIQPTDKCYRASYRAVAKHCIIQDISYYDCLELVGSRTNIIDLINKLRCDGSAEFDDTACNGEQEHEVMVYDKKTQPHRLVGPATVMWRPSSAVEKSSTIWLWIHQPMSSQVHDIICAVVEHNEIEIRNISDTLNRFRLTGPKSSVTLLSILRAYHQSVCDAQTVANGDTKVENDVKRWTMENTDTMKKQQEHAVSFLKDFHKQHYHKISDDNHTKHCHNGSVLPLIVNDPRLTLPLQKTMPSFKATTDSLQPTDAASSVSDRSYISPLWDNTLRAQATASHLKDHIVSTRKNEAKFSSEEKRAEWEESYSTPVPVILIRRSGSGSNTDLSSDDRVSSNIERAKEYVNDVQLTSTDDSQHSYLWTVHSGPPQDFPAGWDIILPADWAMSFWIPLIYHRARAGGMRESTHVKVESKTPHFPQDYPDCSAGVKWWNVQADKNHKNHYNKPPSKRPNYSVLASPFPFSPCWDYIFREKDLNFIDSANEGEMKSLSAESSVLLTANVAEVMENSNVVKNLKRNIDKGGPCEVGPIKKLKTEDCDESKVDFRVLRNPTKLKLLQRHLISADSDYDTTSILEHPNMLICVKLSSLNKGIPSPQTMLCVPTCDDVAKLMENFNDLLGKGLSNCSGPVEPKHWDPYREDRKLAAKEVKKRRKIRKTATDSATKATIMKRQPYRFGVFPSRTVIGFVTSGDFLFSYATGGGVGFVSLQGIIELHRIKRENPWLSSFLWDNLQSRGLLALMRNVDCTQYRFVTVDLVI